MPLQFHPLNVQLCLANFRLLVNLRVLQLVGVVDIHRFPGGVEVQRSCAPFAVAVAGLFRCAEGQMDLGADDVEPAARCRACAAAQQGLES
jgi:hypothetical protein